MFIPNNNLSIIGLLIKQVVEILVYVVN
ncbi:hypothetical protein LEUM_1621 [Leuconostoc mesenteroides subsp. mesenteroides ATCC 8293]|uniref:Uncharacterized protein n=1 Tax=Leuconostoc mesenteroides subsp. mesenteroides (strain ATCC 8293 / DSM 20343 / BCRC 11652 / CCM 1803 / JCM 6124 / NCDO 523 / NBRC 100496 / NCIMB 8023 / NCTC 12954 / NRRL B-1118 / 37Y) TaxID=203120 RepID=Q03VQ9_LEUMM|nr:hypothetical protein LEUM_1621 [Leuconostoc mesenteroides subsp. mesenteroides ATCC 8293]